MPKAAGLKGLVHLEKRALAQTEDPPALGGRGGIIVVNPPYGERLGEVEGLKKDYELLGDLFKKKFPGWTGYVFTSNPDLAKAVGAETRAALSIVQWGA